MEKNDGDQRGTIGAALNPIGKACIPCIQCYLDMEYWGNWKLSLFELFLEEGLSFGKFRPWHS
jgi:hypothetical protein